MATNKDIEKAKECFQLAAEHDYVIAYLYMARIEFFTKHITKAFKFANKGRRLLREIGETDPGDSRLLGIDVKTGKLTF